MLEARARAINFYRLNAIFSLLERLPFRSSNDSLGMEGVACVLKRDAKFFGVEVAEKGV